MTALEFIALLVTAPLGLKLLDYVVGAGKAYFASRKSLKLNLSQTALEERRLEQMRNVDMSKVRRDEFETLMSAATDMAKSAMERARIAEDDSEREREARKKCECEFEGKLDAMETQLDRAGGEIKKLKEEHSSCGLIIAQIERNLRFAYDNFAIAYWESDSKGSCIYTNETFQGITGLTPTEAAGEGWFAAIEARERDRVIFLWRNFIANFQTHCQFGFSFRNVVSGEVTRVKVHCATIMLDGLKVHKYTAQTRTPMTEGLIKN